MSTTLSKQICRGITVTWFCRVAGNSGVGVIIGGIGGGNSGSQVIR